LGNSPTASQITDLVQRTLQIAGPALAELKSLPGSTQDKGVLNQNLIAPNQTEETAARAFLNEMSAAGGDQTKQQAAFNKFQSAVTDPQQQAHDAALAAYGFGACSKTNQ
jgi:hypothetical protein